MFPLLFTTNSVLFPPVGVVLPITNRGSMATLVELACTESSPHGDVVPTPNRENESTRFAVPSTAQKYPPYWVVPRKSVFPLAAVSNLTPVYTPSVVYL